MIEVEAFIALKPNELGAEARSEDLGDVGFADARLALEKERPLELQGEVDRRRQPAVRDVTLPLEQGLGRTIDYFKTKLNT